MIRYLLFLIAASVSVYGEETAFAQLSSISTQIPPTNQSASLFAETVDMIQNFDLNAKKDKLTAKVEGVYFIIASGQCASLNKASTGYLDIWFVKNSKPIPNSNCRLSVDRPISTTVLITQFLVSLSPGDTIGTDFSASAPNLGFMFTQPDNEPANTSFFFSIFKVD